MPSSRSSVPFRADRDLYRIVWLTPTLFPPYLGEGMSLQVTSIYVTTQLGFGTSLS